MISSNGGGGASQSSGSAQGGIPRTRITNVFIITVTDYVEERAIEVYNRPANPGVRVRRHVLVSHG